MPHGARRALLLSLGLVAASLGTVAWIVASALEPEALKPRLAAWVLARTGRTLTVAGPIAIRPGLVPAITLDRVILSNPPGFSRPDFASPPGFSRPDFASIERVEVALALLPLLSRRVEVEYIRLIRPDIRIETDAAGHGNWVFVRPPAPATAQAGNAGGGRTEGFAVAIADFSVEAARVAWLDGQGDKEGDKQGWRRRAEVEIPRLVLSAPGAGQAVHATGTLIYDGRTFGFDAAADLAESAIRSLVLTLTAPGSTMRIDATIARRNADVAMSLNAASANPAGFFPVMPVGDWKDVSLHAETAGPMDRVPEVSALDATVGSVAVAGVRIAEAVLTARAGQPMRIRADIAAAGIAAGIEGTAGDLPWLTKGARGPVNVELTARAGTAQASVRGRIEAPAAMTGYALDVAADIPDPAALAQDAPRLVKAVTLAARLSDAPGPQSFRLTSTAGDLEGALTVALAPRMTVSGQVTSRHLDLDTLRVRAPSPLPPRSPEAGARTSLPSPSGQVIPDTKLPFEQLRLLDADLRFSADTVRLGGTDIAGISGTLRSRDGAAGIDRFRIDGAGMALTGRATADASVSPPSVHLDLQSPGLALGPLLAALGLPRAADGIVAIDVDLTGAGDSPHAIAASLTGRLGMALQGGTLNAAIVNEWLTRLRPLRIDGAETTELRCFALRADLAAGIATIDAAALSTLPLIVEGGGAIDLGRETLALRLRPRAAFGGTGIALPLRIGGTLRAPRTAIDIAAGGPLAGLLLGGKDVMSGDPCPAALARARGGSRPAQEERK